MSEDQAHLITCPVCFELPEKEIYQCKNGHTICHKCSDLDLCPQCRVPFEKEKIRNRALEDLIANMTVVCDYRKGGCRAKLSRKELEAHLQVCQYRPFCQIVGLKIKGECKVPIPNPDFLFRHLSSGHGLPINLTYADAGKTLSLSNILEYMKNEQGTSTTFRSLWEVDSGFGFFKKTQYLVCYHVNFELGDFSIFGIHFGKVESQKYYLTIKIKAARKDLIWIWKGIPTYFKKSGSLKANPPFKIPIRYMLELGKQGGLHHKLKFTKT